MVCDQFLTLSEVELARQAAFMLVGEQQTGLLESSGEYSNPLGSLRVRAYPLVVIARVRKHDALERLALTHLRVRVRVRQTRLFDGNMFWRTSEPREGVVQKGNRAWARGRCLVSPARCAS